MLGGRIALVTGRARGIGAACFKVLSAEGARVIVADLSSESCVAAFLGSGLCGASVLPVAKHVTLFRD